MLADAAHLLLVAPPQRLTRAAAAIMVVVFLSFVLGANVSVKQVGLGLAVAVLIDATLVRLVLVPAVMELLGNANWWLPAPLARLLPASSRVPVDGIEPPVGMDEAIPAAAR
jgi:RND superfamily putative drug exporter